MISFFYITEKLLWMRDPLFLSPSRFLRHHSRPTCVAITTVCGDLKTCFHSNDFKFFGSSR